jgi:hypothetical protein
VWKCKACNQKHDDIQSIHEHISQFHPFEDIDFLTEMKRVHRNLGEQQCPFCAKVPGVVRFVEHICRHLEEIALTVLPQEVDQESGSGYDNETDLRLDSLSPNRQPKSDLGVAISASRDKPEISNGSYPTADRFINIGGNQENEANVSNVWSDTQSNSSSVLYGLSFIADLLTKPKISREEQETAKNRVKLSRKEREAAYKRARERIFGLDAAEQSESLPVDDNESTTGDILTIADKIPEMYSTPR